MAKTLQRKRQAQREPSPLSKDEAERLFTESAAAGAALQDALKEVATYEREIGTATAEVGQRFARWSSLDRRAQDMRGRVATVTGDWLRFYGGRSTMQRMLAISARLASRIDETTETVRQRYKAVGERLTNLRETVAVAEGALVRTKVRQVIAAGRAAYALADRQTEVVDFVGEITRATNGASGNDVDQNYREFERLLENEYRIFASRESYPKEADAYATLQGLFMRMREIRFAPRLASRNICAVAGGFSSGKSTFLNALIGGDKPILPTQITPTTSIPTYIFHVDDPVLTVNAYNHHGGHAEIKPDMFQRMTHSFKRDHGIELKRLVHRVAIYTPRLQSWRNLALIDTPGYSNPEGDATGTGERDEDIALANVLDSHFLIWVVDCDSGTIPAQDLQFIREFVDGKGKAASEGMPLFLVLNKGDKKTAQERQDILKQAEDTAKKHAVPFAGIGVYSSHDDRWYAHEGLRFNEFLERVNRAQSSRTRNLANTARAVFQQYIDYHEQEADQLGKASGLLNRLALALSQPDGDSGKLAADLQKRRAYLRKMKADHESLREEAQQLQERFTAAVTAFVEGINAMNEVGTAPPE